VSTDIHYTGDYQVYNLQCESKKIPPWGFLTFFPNGWEFLVQILHAYYTFLFMLEYKFLFNYLQHKSSGVVSCIATLTIDSLPMVSCYRPIVTLSLKCTVFETRHIGRKSPEKPTPPTSDTFLWGDPLRIFWRLIPCEKLESWGYQTVYISRSCYRSARHNTGVWRTSGQTDRQTDRHVAVAKTALA